MARPPSPLPAALVPTGPFSVRAARAAGVGPERLRGRDLETPTKGVRLLRHTPPDEAALARTPSARLLRHLGALALALPHDVAFSHGTAARILNLPTPAPWPGPWCSSAIGLEHHGEGELVDVMRAGDRPRIARRGWRSHRGLESRTVLDVGGLRTTGHLDTLADVAPTWPLDDLVAAADALLRRMICTPTDLDGLAESRAGRPGVAGLTRAVLLARPGAASAWESKARVRFAEWGLPEPELNAHVIAPDGTWLAMSDFLWRERKVVGEFDGDQHRTNRHRWQAERERRAGIEDAGWTYVEFTSRTFTEPRLAEALRQRLLRLLLWVGARPKGGQLSS